MWTFVYLATSKLQTQKYVLYDHLPKINISCRRCKIVEVNFLEFSLLPPSLVLTKCPRR